MESKEIEVTLKIKLRTTVEDIEENNKEVVRFLVEDDLEELGYEVYSVDLIG